MSAKGLLNPECWRWRLRESRGAKMRELAGWYLMSINAKLLG
jgi:hypothetical protein